MRLLAIESSCDETAAAVVEDGRTILSSVIYSQINEHANYGGVVPEIASRRHVEQIVSVTTSALSDAGATLDDVDAICVTYTPGLIGALLVGVNFAKGLSLTKGLPLVPVHHIRGHIAANYLAYKDLEPPFLALVVSGGHSHIVEVCGYTDFKVIGKTRDDAAGEAFDKAARVLGFGYPGGIAMDKAAQQAGALRYKLPHPKVASSPYDFSFSGLKTAVINLVHNAEQKGEPLDQNAMAASFSETVAEILTTKFFAAAKEFGYKTLVCAGGVSANTQLRNRLTATSAAEGFKLYIPPLPLCGDNAAMIAAQGYYEYRAGNTASMDLNAAPSTPLEKSYTNR